MEMTRELRDARIQRVLHYATLAQLKSTSSDVSRHIRHGVGRRITILRRNYHFIEDVIVKAGGQPITGDCSTDLQIHLNSLYIHLRGTMDNLAWAFLHLHAGEDIPSEDDPKTRRAADFFSK
jgi:hypothetical protein